MSDELIDAFDEADADDDVRAIIVTGAGRAFCAGADLSVGRRHVRPRRQSVRSNGAGRPARLSRCQRARRRRTHHAAHFQLPQTRHRGGERAGGRHRRHDAVADGCAHRVERGAVRLRVLRRGIVPEAASSYFLPRIVGISQALEWCYSGRVFGAGGARRRPGQPGRAAGRIAAAARALAREFIDNTAPVSVALIRQMMWRMLCAGHPMEAHRLDSRACSTAAAART